DVIVWYTDGLTECPDAQGRQYGAPRLAQIIQHNGELPADQLRDAIIADVKQYMRGTRQSDDITVVVAEYAA
ncbi:MAG TPA: SpoIIE family protein phosphatase, partial [Myxococcaceae bacterium]|nr:SpoIIE family protein phosphatase [Myxococcaceae bacterium]